MSNETIEEDPKESVLIVQTKTQKKAFCAFKRSYKSVKYSLNHFEKAAFKMNMSNSERKAEMRKALLCLKNLTKITEQVIYDPRF